MTADPNGCRWCGKAPDNHGWQQHPAVGLHQWEKPTMQQKTDRMTARRPARNQVRATRGER
ncbi:hypothetical protein [Streptomyces griseosporeus]|uniref:hypothetical protein n=1 Tax=Streptomyces griseosporeus TaxID=1910 RepID=UPI0036FA8F0F